ncbi:MAG: cyclic nucleotide-binding domain-containing protein [Spirochaetota bacterium]|nr:cyclic nucleotide-binding domain-containing protein [Spirochaetota bacterium]
MNEQEVYIYIRNGETDTAYMLKRGGITIELNEYDSFEIKGDNVIFGTMEILMSEADGYNHFRVYSVKTGPEAAEYVRIPAKTILQMATTYNIGFAIGKSIAEILIKVNGILTKKKNEVGEKERLSQEYCKIYAWAADTLIDHFENKRFPWLESLANSAKASLTYAKGSAFSSFDRKTRFDVKSEEEDEFSKVFPPGSNICKQGDSGDELYILKSGKLKVLINDEEITTIEDPGSVIGEMALLLGETRTATLQSVDHTVLTVVKKSNLKAFAEANPLFLKTISTNLSRRVQSNTTVVNDLTEIIEQNKKQDNSLPHALREDKYKEELKDLKDSIKQLYTKYDMDWLYDLVSAVTEKMLDVRK